MKPKHTIALIGRTNVGKSTLFNKLIEENKALTSSIPNTTRDRNYGEIIWRGEKIKIIDTGGLDAFDFVNIKKTDAGIEEQILEQTYNSFEEANLVLFVINGKEGVLPQEKKIAEILRKIKQPIILVCNKVDSKNIEQNIDINEILKLNFGEPSYISAKSGRGTGDLLDEVYEKLFKGEKQKSSPAEEQKNEESLPCNINITLIGKPNVGKSSLLNSILNKKYAITSPMEHTTREPKDAVFNYKKNIFTVIDTAGIRKKAHIKKGMEDFGVRRSLETLEKADVAILVTDVSSELSTQDNYLAEEVRKSGCGLIIVANKWDLISGKKTNTINEYTKIFYNRFPYLWWAPILFTSALEKIRVKDILDLAAEVTQEKNKIVDKEELKKFTKKFIEYHKPTRGKGAAKPRVKDFFQARTNPPTFVLELYPNADLHKSYLKYIENQIRKNFGFKGAPIRIDIEQGGK
ncbi:MAG: ribosome biogenesis GTPase Der [bacterium]